MTVQEKIKTDMVQAMRDKNSVKVAVLRGVMANFTNELVNKKKKPNEQLTDEEAVTVILRAIKQRKDSIEQFKAGGRSDLVSLEGSELSVLEEYGPKFMSLAEVTEIAKKKKDELGITDKTKMGQLMGVLIKELKSRADGTDVKNAVEGLFK